MTPEPTPSAPRVSREIDPLDATHLGPEAVRRYLRAHRLEPTKRFSQNHLVDGSVLEAILDAAEPLAGQRVLEIGPGVGILTGGLLSRGAEVVAVEVDRRLVAHLRDRFADRPGIEIVEGDVLDLGHEELIGQPFATVANLPYHITSPVLHQLLGSERRPERFVLMLQREVAERIAAPPGAMSYLSVFVQYHADVAVRQVVPSAAFEPPPDVASAILVGTVRPRTLDLAREERLWRVVQAAFRERRKMLHNVLPRQLPQIGRERFTAALEVVGIAPDRRPQTVSMAEWLALVEEIGEFA